MIWDDPRRVSPGGASTRPEQSVDIAPSFVQFAESWALPGSSRSSINFDASAKGRLWDFSAVARRDAERRILAKPDVPGFAGANCIRA